MTKDQARRKRYRDSHPDRVKASDSRYRILNKEKISARSAVNYQIRAGYLVKPTRCENCSKESKVEAHHNDYKKKLEVIWLCKDCHEKV